MSCIAGIFPIAFPGERKDCGLFATFYIWWDVRANRRNTGRTTFERWSYQKIASLLASERLECSPLAHSRRLETRSNILAVYRAFSIFLLRIDGILFSFVSFPLIILFFSLSPSLYFSLFLCIHIYIYIYLPPHFCVTKIVSRGSTFTDWLFVLRDPLMNDLASGGNRTTRRQNYMWGRMVAIIGQDVFLRVSSWVKCLKRNCMGRGDRCYVWRIVPLGILRFFLFSFATWRY